ncbi:MAG: DUF1579 family protein [Planctomycetota bacterium]
MLRLFSCSIVFAIALISVCNGQEETAPEVPGIAAMEDVAELEVIRDSIGVWDAVIKVWPMGPDGQEFEFEGVETNRPYGEHWMASDFDSVFQGQRTSVHSIVGYDLNKKQLFGFVVDAGPYAATMTGEYDADTKTVQWTTNAQQIDGSPMVQHTTLTKISDTERKLVLAMPAEEGGEAVTVMEIMYTKRE